MQHQGHTPATVPVPPLRTCQSQQHPPASCPHPATQHVILHGICNNQGTGQILPVLDVSNKDLYDAEQHLFSNNWSCPQILQYTAPPNCSVSGTQTSMHQHCMPPHKPQEHGQHGIIQLRIYCPTMSSANIPCMKKLYSTSEADLLIRCSSQPCSCCPYSGYRLGHNCRHRCSLDAAGAVQVSPGISSLV